MDSPPARPYPRRLSELARRVLHAAEQTAAQFEHPAVGVGHLLLVLALEERSSTAALLRACGLDTMRLLRALETRDEALMASINPALDEAFGWARHTGSHFTGTEHLLLALMSDAAGARALHNHQTDVDMLRRSLQNGTR